MRSSIVLAILAAIVAEPSQARSEPSVAAATPAYSVNDSALGTLIDNPATKAALDKHLLALSTNPRIGMARSMTPPAIAPFSPDPMTDKVLADIRVDFNKLTPAK